MIPAVKPLPLFVDEVVPVLTGRQSILRRLKETTSFPLGKCGDIFWIQEDLRLLKEWVYAADCHTCRYPPAEESGEFFPAMLLPRICSRGSVTVLDWWVEQVKDATDEEVELEYFDSWRAFARSWDRHYPKHPVASNPLTWVISISARITC